MFLIPAIIILLWFPINALLPGEITLEHLKSLKPYSAQLKTKNYSEIIKTVQNKRNPSFIEAFLTAELLSQQGKSEQAVQWYASSAFLQGSLPSKPYPSVVLPFLKKRGKPSALYQDALYEIARSFLRSHGPKYATEVLKLLPESPHPALQKRLQLLNGEIISQLNWKVARELYKAMIEIDDKTYYHLKLAGIMYIAKEYKKSLEKYFYILEHSTSTWEKKIALRQIKKIINLKAPQKTSQLSNRHRILYAKELQAQGNYSDSLLMYNSIGINKLTPEELGDYLKYNSRLKIKIKQFRKLEKLVRRHQKKLSPEQNNELLEELAVSLHKAHRYHMVIRLVPAETKRKRALLYRLAALEKIEAPGREIEAGNYLMHFDKNSDWAEEFYFKVCFTHLKNNNQQEAAKCLTRLKELTVKSPSGGRSRFYLARLLEKQGKKLESLAMDREVYLNSPSHFYAYLALKRLPVKNQPMPEKPISLADPPERQEKEFLQLRLWIADHYSNPEAIARYFQKKQKSPEFGVDPYWLRLERQLQNIKNNMSHAEQMAALYSAMGLTWRGRHYRAQISDKKRLYLVLLTGATATENENLKYRYLSAIMHTDGKETDVMTLSPPAIESLFPTPYRNIVHETKKRFSIDEAHIYALMKQESAFHPGVTSRSGAMGLMQIMPNTAKWLNQYMKIRNLNLYNPAHAIPMAAKFYSDLYRSNGGTLEKVAIAYNAGPARLRQWLRQFNHDNLEFFLEEIPVYETYNYVQKTRRYYDRYKILLSWYYPSL